MSTNSYAAPIKLKNTFLFTTGFKCVVALATSLTLVACNSSSSTPADDLLDGDGGDPSAIVDNGGNNNSVDGDTSNEGEEADAQASLLDLSNVNIADVEGNPEVYPNESNSTRLFGPVVGTNTLMNSEIVKRLTISGQTNSERLGVVAAFATRESQARPNNADIVIALINLSDQSICSLQVDYEALNSSGDSLGSGQTSRGGAMLNTNDPGADLTDINNRTLFSCIPANSVIHVDGLEFMSFDFDEVAELVFEVRTNDINIPETLPLETASVKPLSYTVNENATISVLLENQNPENIYELEGLRITILDEMGLPLGSASGDIREVFLAPGDTVMIATFTSDNGPIAGMSTSIRAEVNVSLADPER